MATMPARNEQYKLSMNWPNNLTGKGVKIAVLDYDIKHYHPQAVIQIIKFLAPDAEIIHKSVLTYKGLPPEMTHAEALQWCIDKKPEQG
jgi:hypothetical protein